MHIVHISSVHNANDPRIRLKQLNSIVKYGWQATLVTGDLSSEEGDAVRIIRILPGNSRRILRLLVTSPRAILKAFCLDADVYHVHDPELLPWALLLRLKNRPVVYDVHEDYVTSVQQKRYLPPILRPLAAAFAGLADRLTRLFFYQVIAEKYYGRRFPQALSVLNYPVQSLLECGTAFNPQSKHILYTGNLTRDRGGLHLARLVLTRPDYKVSAIGYCPASLAADMRREAGDAASCLSLLGEDRYVLFEEIMEAYKRRKWLAGIALFPESDHYRQKELTKFFEYMAVGLPIIASNFPAWVDLIEKQGFGLCVDPENFKEVGNAIDWLRDHPDQAMAMGQRGREAVRKKYNWEIEAKKLLAFYDQLA
jgi:glycosyltransferase involved in cell wall biosynthesis